MKRYPRLNKLALFEDLGYHPHPGQLAVHKSTASRRVLACGSRWGKTLCAAWEAVGAVLQPCAESLGWIVAPSYDVADRIYVTVRDILVTKFPHRIIHEDHRWRTIKVRNLGGGVSELKAKSAEHAASLLGVGLDWVVIEEAQSLKADVWEGHISQRLIDRNGWALIIGTPKEGWLHDLYRLGQDEAHPDCESWSRPSWDNPRLDREVIERERERLPDDVFRSVYGGEFVRAEPPRCKKCGGPRPTREGRNIVMLQEDEELGVCELCGGLTDQNALSILSLEPDGRIGWMIIRLRKGSGYETPLPGFEKVARPVFTTGDQDEAGFVPDSCRN